MGNIMVMAHMELEPAMPTPVRAAGGILTVAVMAAEAAVAARVHRRLARSGLCRLAH